MKGGLAKHEFRVIRNKFIDNILILKGGLLALNVQTVTIKQTETRLYQRIRNKNYIFDIILLG